MKAHKKGAFFDKEVILVDSLEIAKFGFDLVFQTATLFIGVTTLIFIIKKSSKED